MGLSIGMNKVAVMPAGSVATPGGSGGDGGGRRPFPFRRHKPSDVVEASSILDLPPGAIPGAAQASIAALVGEVERLREEAEQSRHVEAFLAAEADRHPLLPVLNRRAFLRELGRLLALSEREALPGTLVYLHLGEVERLRVEQGLAAGDAALVHLAAVLRSALRQTDLVGYLDGADFAVALAVCEDDVAGEKVAHIVRTLAGRQFLWLGRPVHFAIGLGMVHFRAEASAEQLLGEADAARRQAMMGVRR